MHKWIYVFKQLSSYMLGVLYTIDAYINTSDCIESHHGSFHVASFH